MSVPSRAKNPFDTIINELVQTINIANEDQDIRSSIKDATKTFLADNKEFLHKYVRRELARNHKSSTGFWANNAAGTATIYGLGDLNDIDFKLSHPRLRLANKFGEHGMFNQKYKQNIGSHIEDKLLDITRSLLDKYFRDVDNQVFRFVELTIVPKIESDLNKLLSEANLVKEFTDADVANISSQCNTPVSAYDMKKLIIDYLHEHHPNIHCQELIDRRVDDSSKIELPTRNPFNRRIPSNVPSQKDDSAIWHINGYDLFNTTFA